MTVDLKWACLGVADETTVTTTTSGTGDTATPAWVVGTAPKIDTANLVNAYPMMRLNQVAATATYVMLPVPTGSLRTAGFVFRSPSAWPASSAHIFRVLNAAQNAVCAQILIGGSGSPGEIRLTNAAGTVVSAGNVGSMATNTNYYIELQVNQPSGTARLRLWNGAGTSLIFDTGSVASSYGTNMGGLSIGLPSTTPTVGTCWVGLLVSDPTITTLGGPLGTSVVTYPRVRGVILSGIERAASIRGVMLAGVEVLLPTVREVTGVAAVSDGFTQIFSDQFSTLSSADWYAYDQSTFGAPDRVQRYMAANNVLATGVSGATGGTALKMMTKREAIGGQAFTAAMLDSKTASKYYPRYGRFEIRCKTPHGQGLWPAFWLTGRNGGANMVEFDVMEYFHSQRPGQHFCTMHGMNNSAVHVHNKYKQNVAYPFETPTYSPGWHTWSVEIQPVTSAAGTTVGDPTAASTYVRFITYLDGVETWRVVDTTALYWTTNCQGFQIYLQGCQIGGEWVGLPDEALGYASQGPRCLIGGTPPSACSTTYGGYSVQRAGAAGSTATLGTDASALIVDNITVWQYTG